jgi:predicted homoserine dehydrogenase-like protein
VGACRDALCATARRFCLSAAASPPIGSMPPAVTCLPCPRRVGIIGAGGNTKLRHIPNLLEIPGVQLRTVCNRSLGSSRAAAEAFGIPGATDSWRQVIDDPDIDAVVIGTWPYMHATLTCAALAAGKHVLCEARMVGGVAA